MIRPQKLSHTLILTKVLACTPIIYLVGVRLAIIAVHTLCKDTGFDIILITKTKLNEEEIYAD